MRLFVVEIFLTLFWLEVKILLGLKIHYSGLSAKSTLILKSGAGRAELFFFFAPRIPLCFAIDNNVVDFLLDAGAPEENRKKEEPLKRCIHVEYLYSSNL